MKRSRSTVAMQAAEEVLNTSAKATRREAAIAARRSELEECQQKLNELLEQYDASLAVTEINTFRNGNRFTQHQIAVESR